MKHENEHVKSSRDNTCWHCEFDDVGSFGYSKLEIAGYIFFAIGLTLMLSYIIYAVFS